MIDGVLFKELKTFPDERGFFRELIRADDPFFAEGFGQWSVSRLYTGVVKAWHYHHLQTDWWYVHCGVLRIGLHDLRETSPTRGRSMDFLLGDNQALRALKIPPGVAHGCKAIQGPADLFYVTSRVYDPSDEIRLPHDDPGIGFDWLRGAPIT